MKTKLLVLLFSTACGYVSAQNQFSLTAQTPNAAKWERKPDFSKAFKPDIASMPQNNNATNSRRYATCANRPGVLQWGLGYGTTIGIGGMIVTDTSLFPYIEAGIGAMNHFNLRVQYGISERISLGVYLRKDAGTFSTTAFETFFNGFKISGASVGLEMKTYLLNHEYFTVYVAPIIGASFGTATINDKEKNNIGKGSGFNYGGTFGLNWYWTETFGMSFDLGYTTAFMAGKFNDVKGEYLDYELATSGYYVGVGLVLNVDTRHY